MTSIQYNRLLKISGKRTSSNRSLFFDLINNPQNYKGYIIYLTEVDEDELYTPFEEPKKFYFNEGGLWQNSDFVNITGLI
jgi:hypothetical protein